MNQNFSFEYATLVGVARHFETAGMTDAATKAWEGLCLTHPYEQLPRERLGSLLFDQGQADYVPGSIERSRFILKVIFKSFPTEKLRIAYFENLELLLANRPKRSRPGEVVLGIGTGRCGSTTLSAAVASVPEACATHENPPLIYWGPLEEQVRFHFDRLRLLANYYALVFDASHWWLNVLGRFFAEFPEGKVIGLHRDTESCVQSFLTTKGRGRRSLNHWAPAGNSIWLPAPWDPTYPSYPIPAELVDKPDAAKAEMIRRYVSQYNQALVSLANTHMGRVLLIPTEEFSDPTTATRIGAFLGRAVAIPSRALNVGSTLDSDHEIYRQ